jgi:hypothetical protein
LVSDQPGEPHGVDVHVVDFSAARTLERLGGCIRRRLAATGLRDHLRRPTSCAARRVDLVGVMQLDDLD